MTQSQDFADAIHARVVSLAGDLCELVTDLDKKAALVAVQARMVELYTVTSDPTADKDHFNELVHEPISWEEATDALDKEPGVHKSMHACAIEMLTSIARHHGGATAKPYKYWGEHIMPIERQAAIIHASHELLEDQMVGYMWDLKKTANEYVQRTMEIEAKESLIAAKESK